MARAWAELENIKDAIRQGVATPKAKVMLEDAERRVAEFEAAMCASALGSSKVGVSRFRWRILRNPQDAPEIDTDRARLVLPKLLHQIPLRNVAELRGNLSRLLNLEEN